MHTTAPTRPVEPTHEQLASGEDEWIRYLFGPSLVPLRPGLPAAQAITHAGLGWRVEQLPLLADQGDQLAPITTHVANVRSDTRAPIGVVGAKYRPIQNREALAVAEAIIDTGGAHWVGIAQTRGGARTHAILRLPREIRIGGDEDERILPLLRLTNTHDGSSALTVSVCPYRVVCRNGLALPLTGAERTWRVRHTVNADYRIQEARRALGVSFRYLDQLERVGEQLAAQSMDDVRFEAFLSSVLPITGTTHEQRARQTPRVERARLALRQARNAPDLANIRETRWGALQAVTNYATHDRPTRRSRAVSEADATFERVTERAPLTDRALALLTA